MQYATPYGSGAPRPFLGGLIDAVGDVVSGVGGAVGDVLGSIPVVGDVIDVAARLVSTVLGSGPGRALASALCVGFGAPPSACAAGVTAAGKLSRALVTGGQSRHVDGPVYAQQSDQCQTYGTGTVCRFGGGYVFLPYGAPADISSAVEAGAAWVWFPGWPQWVHVSELSQTPV